eukprot:s1089_g9.t1
MDFAVEAYQCSVLTADFKANGALAKLTFLPPPLWGVFFLGPRTTVRIYPQAAQLHPKTHGDEGGFSAFPGFPLQVTPFVPPWYGRDLERRTFKNPDRIIKIVCPTVWFQSKEKSV